MTAEEFAVQVEALIEACRVGDLSDGAIRDTPEKAAEALGEGMT
jgi:hypothetical protein